MKEKKNLWIVLLIVIILILVDQITKLLFQNNSTVLIHGILNSTPVQNKGGAFGIGQNSTITFIVTNVIVLGIMIRFMVLQEHQMDKKTKFALSLVLAGGFSNLLDRIIRGYVVDFLDISPIFPFPKFNLADIYITIGWVCLAAFFAAVTWKEIKARKRKEE